MIATWMLVTLVLGALVAAAAWCASELAATRRLPMRWAWVGGMLLLVTLAALTPWRRSTTTVMATLPASALVAPTAVAPATDAPTLAARLGAALEATRALAERTLGGATTLATPLQWLLATLWLSATCAVLAVLALTWRRMRRARATWPVHDVDGLPVRIAPHGAPMVMGITAPEIVLPAWALALPAARRTLVLAHEREHVAARDPWLLAMAATIVALLPWHPAAWWMASRLARAIETDCDARVLAAGVPVRDYGALLLDVAAVPCAPSLLAPWPALGGERSTLETRILAMTSRPSRHPLLRTGAFGAAALALVVVACDSSKLPTSAEVERMDASQATARVMAVSSASGPIAYFVDGAPVSDTRARALPADSIGSMQVERRVIDGVEGSTVRITTRAARVASGAVPVASGAPQTERVVVRRMPDGRADTSRVVAFLNGQQAPITGTARFSATGDTAVIVQTSGGPAPTYYIDGVKADASALKTLAPDRIASVEILKGDAARAQYGADGANGVIRITTKKTR